MWSAAVITLLVALFGFVLIAFASRHKSVRDHQRPLYSMWISIAFIGISIVIYTTLSTHRLLDKPGDLADLLVMIAVVIAFSLMAWASTREIRKRKSRVRPHP